MERFLTQCNSWHPTSKSHVYRDGYQEQQIMHLLDTLIILLMPQRTEKGKQGFTSNEDTLLLSKNSSFSKH